MEVIRFERWKVSDKDPNRMEYLGQRSAKEVFEELYHRLLNMGYLPDEYFLLSEDWKDGRLIPEEADFFCCTDYGESEGIFIDGYLKWFKDGKSETRKFFTAKTLGDTGADLDRMHLIASAITKAFHGYGGQYARYIRLGEPKEGGDMILNLTPKEQQVMIDALLERRESLIGKVDAAEQMLRRLTGSITQYMDTVGAKPMTLSPFDRAMLAIRDGELDAFKRLYLDAANQADEMLQEAAGRPGNVGRKMTALLLASIDRYDGESYLAASKRAVDTGDGERVKLLMEQAGSHVPELDPEYYGKVIQYAVSEHHQKMANELVKDSPVEWISHAPPSLLSLAVMWKLWYFAESLVSKGLAPGVEVVQILTMLIRSNDAWVIEILLREGMEIPKDYYPAFRACVNNNSAEAAKTLIDYGFDVDAYCAWAQQYGKPDEGEQKLVEELCQYAAEKKAKETPDGKAS